MKKLNYKNIFLFIIMLISAIQYAKNYIINNIEENYEYYFYKTAKDLKDNSHYDVIIANEVLDKGDEE